MSIQNINYRRFAFAYEITASNVEKLSDAKVICIGEQHDQDHMRKDAAELIDTLTREGDVVLIEDDSQGQILNVGDIQSKYIKSQVPIYGWDMPLQTNVDFAEAIHRAEHPDSYLRYGSWLGRRIRSLIPTTPGCKTLCCFYSAMCCLELLSVASCCIKKYYTIEAERLWQEALNEVYDQNVHMNQEILKALNSYERVFVIGGDGHFNKTHDIDEDGFDYTPTHDAVDETINFFKKHRIPYAILQHKDLTLTDPRTSKSSQLE